MRPIVARPKDAHGYFSASATRDRDRVPRGRRRQRRLRATTARRTSIVISVVAVSIVIVPRRRRRVRVRVVQTPSHALARRLDAGPRARRRRVTFRGSTERTNERTNERTTRLGRTRGVTHEASLVWRERRRRWTSRRWVFLARRRRFLRRAGVANRGESGTSHAGAGVRVERNTEARIKRTGDARARGVRREQSRAHGCVEKVVVARVRVKGAA